MTNELLENLTAEMRRDHHITHDRLTQIIEGQVRLEAILVRFLMLIERLEQADDADAESMPTK